MVKAGGEKPPWKKRGFEGLSSVGSNPTGGDFYLPIRVSSAFNIFLYAFLIF